MLENDHWGVDALFILQKLALIEDIIGVVKNDPNSLLKGILGKFDDTLESKKAEIIKMVGMSFKYMLVQKRKHE